MTVDLETAVKALSTTRTTATLRPRYEGNNINTWIGFKHVNYLVEEAVLEHLRAVGLPSRMLFEEYGLGVDIVDLDTRILNAFHLDDLVTATVTPRGEFRGGAEFRVVVTRDGHAGKDVTATVRVVLRRETFVDPPGSIPPELAALSVDRIGDGEPVAEPAVAAPDVFGWRWRIGYPYCHSNQLLQMSGYLRLLEETVDLFLADRGISIRTLLDERRWIPVVPHSRITMLDEAYLEEELELVYTVTEIFKDFTYTARLDTYVVRDGRRIHTAIGTITHGYAVFADRRDWRLVGFDDRVLRALRGRP